MAKLLSLPKEILTHIVSYVYGDPRKRDGYKDLLGLYSTSKELQAITEPFYYHWLSVNSSESIKRSKEMFDQRPDLRPMVKDIELKCREDSNEPFDGEGGFVEMLASFSNVEYVQVVSDAWQSKEWEKQVARSLAKSVQAPFTALKTARIYYWRNSEDSQFCDILGAIALLKLPSLKNLTLHNYEIDCDFETSGLPELHCLELLNCGIDTEKLTRLANARPTKAIRITSDDSGVNTVPGYHAPASADLINALASSRNSASVQLLMVNQDDEEGDDELTQKHFNLRGFSSLRFLLLPGEQFLRMQGSRSAGSENLPGSLEEIYMTPTSVRKMGFCTHIIKEIAMNKEMFPKFKTLYFDVYTFWPDQCGINETFEELLSKRGVRLAKINRCCFFLHLRRFSEDFGNIKSIREWIETGR